MLNISIIPVTVFPSSATQLQIFQVLVDLNNVASCSYNLLSASGVVLISGTCSLTGPQYNGWANDDTYFVNCILTNLGLTQAS